MLWRWPIERVRNRTAQVYRILHNHRNPIQSENRTGNRNGARNAAHRQTFSNIQAGIEIKENRWQSLIEESTEAKKR